MAEANTFNDLIEIQTADTLDTFRTEFNKVANLINLSYSSESGNTELYPDWEVNSIVMRGPNGEFSAGDLVVNNIMLQGEISGRINQLADDDFTTRIKLDGEDAEIDDETIKFYAGGTDLRATINSTMVSIVLDTNILGNLNVYSQVNLQDQLVVYQNTEFKTPIMLSSGNNTVTVGLEGQVRYNIESEEVQAYKLSTSSWTNVASSIDAATDTILTNPLDNEVLTWNGSAWINQVVNPLGSASMDILADVAIDSANVASGHFLHYDGTYWREDTLNFDDIIEIDTVNRTPTDGDVLHWDTANSTWVPNTVANTSTLSGALVNRDIVFTRQDTTLYSVNVDSIFDSVNSMADVDTTGAYQDAILKWDIQAGIGRWIVTAQDSVANSSISAAYLGEQTSVYANTIRVERQSGLDPFNIPLHGLISSIDRLGDVFTKDSNAPIGGQALVWDDVATRWSPNNIVATTANLDANFLYELSDVTNTAPSDSQCLKWSSTTNKWELAEDINDITNKSLNELQDVSIVSPTANSYLKWSGSEWVAASDIVRQEIGDLTNVEINDPLDMPTHMQVLKFNSVTTKWEAHDDSLTEIGSFGLSRLSDVDVETSAPTAGQVLKWDGAAAQWKPVADNSYLQILDTVVLTIMNDVDLVTVPPTTGDILKYDGTVWVAHTPNDDHSVGDTTDVDLTTVPPDVGQVLKWDGTNFTPANDAIADFSTLSFSVFQDVDVASATNGNHLVFNGTHWVPEDADIPRNLNDLLDVSSTIGLQPNMILSWDGSSWTSRAETPVDLTTHSINELSDVTTDAVILATGMYLRWDGGSGWKASPADTVSLDLLDIFANTQALDGQMLLFNAVNDNYEPANIPNQDLDQLTDTNLTGLADDQILRYDAASTKWIPEAPFDLEYTSLLNAPTLSAVAGTGEYADVLNTPTLATVATSGSYTDLSNTPTLHAQSATGSFIDLIDKPTTLAGYGITDAFDGEFSSLTNSPTTVAGYGITDAFDGDYASLTNIPDKMDNWQAEPASSVGQAGDTAGMVSYSSSFMYICIRDFDGADGCWKRITLSSATW